MSTTESGLYIVREKVSWRRYNTGSRGSRVLEEVRATDEDFKGRGCRLDWRVTSQVDRKANFPKLPPLHDWKGTPDSCIQRFQRFAKCMHRVQRRRLCTCLVDWKIPWCLFSEVWHRCREAWSVEGGLTKALRIYGGRVPQCVLKEQARCGWESNS